MHVSYNLRYQKSHITNRLLLDKEGEIIIYEKGFRLKGKGAGDKGEMINFSEIKEFFYRNEKIFFITFNKEKYVLSESGSLFSQLLVDLYRSRNEFLMEALFLKKGKLKAQYEGHFERFSKFGKPINRGRAKLKIFEESMVVVPDSQDAFGINFNFVQMHEFDDMEYSLKIVMDDGVVVNFSQLGNEFEFFEEKMNDILGGMYEVLVNDVLKEAFCEFHAAVLLKFAYKMKGGKAVSMKEIGKIDPDLKTSVENFVFNDEEFNHKIEVFKEYVDQEYIYVGLAKDYAVAQGFIRWVLFAIPEKNLVGFTILPRWEEANQAEAKGLKHHHDIFFYKIIMEKGDPAEKLANKIREIEQSLVQLKFAKDPCYKDKRELKHSPYQYAIRKLPFLRILRKSFVAKAGNTDCELWKQEVKKILSNSA